MSIIKRVSVNDNGATLTEYGDGSTAFVYSSMVRSDILDTTYYGSNSLEVYKEDFPHENWREVWTANPGEYAHLIGTEVAGDKLLEIDRAGYDFEAEFLIDTIGGTHRTNADLSGVISLSPYLPGYILTGVKKR